MAIAVGVAFEVDEKIDLVLVDGLGGGFDILVGDVDEMVDCSLDALAVGAVVVGAEGVGEDFEFSTVVVF